MYTKHALKRCQQRSIPKSLCDVVLNYGEYRYDKHGARIWFLTKRTLEKLDKALGSEVRKDLEKKKNLFVVESLDTNTVITAGYSYKASKYIGRVH
jgi:acid phosphatase class B